MTEPLGEDSYHLILRALRESVNLHREHAKTLRKVTVDNPLLTVEAAQALAADHDTTAEEMAELVFELSPLALYTGVRS